MKEEIIIESATEEEISKYLGPFSWLYPRPKNAYWIKVKGSLIKRIFKHEEVHQVIDCIKDQVIEIRGKNEG